MNGGKIDLTGALTFIYNQVSQSTGTILLRATIANPDHPAAGLISGKGEGLTTLMA